MNHPFDTWYVRLPDGQVVRAKSTEAVRHHVQRQRIPADALVRRSGDEEWQALEWTAEFADLVRPGEGRPARPVASERSNDSPLSRTRHELRPVGVRGMVEELLAAIDGTLVRQKMTTAAVAGLLGGSVLALWAWLQNEVELPALGWLPFAAGLATFLIVGFTAAALTQMTFIDLSRLRPAHGSEIRAMLGLNGLRITLAQIGTAGAVILLIVGLRGLPRWVLERQPDFILGAEALASMAAVAAVFLEVMLWPVLGLALLLGPVVVIEECGPLRAVRQWWSLLRANLSRVFMYEALAVALGGIMTLPFVLPVAVAAWFGLADSAMISVKVSTLYLLGGAALSPLLAYLAVANVYIYLNLRYEFSPTRTTQ